MRLRWFIAAWLLLCLCAPAIAGDRGIIYPLQNPSSVQVNGLQRDVRVMDGTAWRDFFGSSLGNGAYNDMTVAAGTGMYVTVNPAGANTPGTLYQLQADDANPMPINVSPQLPADPTQVVIQGLLTANSAPLGPMTAPGTSGQSVYYLVEAQIQVNDIDPVSQLFVNAAGGKYYETLPSVREDTVVFQLKAGTPSVTPSVPSTDTGWVSVGTVLIPYGTSQITSGMINMSTAFSGFSGGAGGCSTSCVTLNAGVNPSAQTGSAAISGTFNSGSLDVGPNPAPTATGQAKVEMSLAVGPTPLPTATGQAVVSGTLGVGAMPPGGTTKSIAAGKAISAGDATAATLTAGDLGASRSTSSGAVTIGGSAGAATLDYGVTTASVLTDNANTNVAANLALSTTTDYMIFGGQSGVARLTGASANTLAGGTCNGLNIFATTTLEDCFDTSGNFYMNGNAFANSRRATKRDITPLSGEDALTLIHKTKWYTFCRRSESLAQCSQRVLASKTAGFIADDTDPRLSGPHHDREDIVSLVGYEGAAISGLDDKANRLASEAGMTVGLVNFMASEINSLRWEVNALLAGVIILSAVLVFVVVRGGRRHHA